MVFLVFLIIDRLMWFLIELFGLVFLSLRNSLYIFVFRWLVCIMGVCLINLRMFWGIVMKILFGRKSGGMGLML